VRARAGLAATGSALTALTVLAATATFVLSNGAHAGAPPDGPGQQKASSQPPSPWPTPVTSMSVEEYEPRSTLVVPAH